MRPLLNAATPQEFFATHVESRQARHDTAPEHQAQHWLSLVQILDDDAAVLRAGHARLVEAGEPPKAAANYLAGWIGGGLAETVGFVLATAGAGVLVDDRVRWRLHPTGYPDRVDVSACVVVVASGHPWAGQDGVQVAAEEGQVCRRVTAALVEFLTACVDACRALAKVGAASLWAEVADGIGRATALSPDLAARGPTIPALERLLAVPGMPWRKRPSLWTAAGARGPMVVSQKGGCCLAYTAPGSEPAQPSDPDQAAYQARFPQRPGEPRYCSGCCFRDRMDVEDRLVFWSDLVLRRDGRTVEAC